MRAYVINTVTNKIIDVIVGKTAHEIYALYDEDNYDRCSLYVPFDENAHSKSGKDNGIAKF